MALLISLNVSETALPSVVTAVMSAAAMSAVSNPYSMAAAPSSDQKNLENILDKFDLFISLLPMKHQPNEVKYLATSLKLSVFSRIS